MWNLIEFVLIENWKCTYRLLRFDNYTICHFFPHNSSFCGFIFLFPPIVRGQAAYCDRLNKHYLQVRLLSVYQCNARRPFSFPFFNVNVFSWVTLASFSWSKNLTNNVLKFGIRTCSSLLQLLRKIFFKINWLHFRNMAK